MSLNLTTRLARLEAQRAAPNVIVYFDQPSGTCLMRSSQTELNPTNVRPLNELEQALLAALDDHFVSTTVVRDTARLMALKTAPSLARTTLSRTQPLTAVAAACNELERRGLAERIEVARTSRWRRAGTGGVNGMTER